MSTWACKSFLSAGPVWWFAANHALVQASCECSETI